MNKIPVYIITGFLGSGKTTTLNHLLSHFKGSNNIVIENEFGKVSIDSTLVDKLYNDLYELNNGCICCDLNDDLYNVLAQIERNKRKPDNIFIETTGIADAGNVAAIFTRMDVQQVFDLKKIICIVDTENIEELLNEVPESKRQIISADVIALNKIDYLNIDFIKEIKSLVQSINPFATIITSVMGFLPKATLFTKSNHIQNINEVLFKAPKRLNEHRIISVFFTTTEIYNANKLYHALTVTLMLHYTQVYRIKGIIKIEGTDDKILLQSTGKKLHLSTIGKWNDDEIIESRIVVIGLGLKTIFLEKICKNAFAKPAKIELV